LSEIRIGNVLVVYECQASLPIACVLHSQVHPLNFHFARLINSKFVHLPEYSLINFCEDAVELASIQLAYPNALLLHTKGLTRQGPGAREVKETEKAIVWKDQKECWSLLLCSLVQRKHTNRRSSFVGSGWLFSVPYRS